MNKKFLEPNIAVLAMKSKERICNDASELWDEDEELEGGAGVAPNTPNIPQD